jgi:hypothetical protein
MDPKPLEFIQAIIARMAANSTQMKTWNVALATAVIGFVAAKDGSPASAAQCAVAPALAFWALDAYYLALEVRFRELYDAQVNSGAPTYHLSIAPVTVVLFFVSCLRPAVLLLHLPLVGLIYWVSRA